MHYIFIPPTHVWICDPSTEIRELLTEDWICYSPPGRTILFILVSVFFFYLITDILMPDWAEVHFPSHQLMFSPYSHRRDHRVPHDMYCSCLSSLREQHLHLIAAMPVHLGGKQNLFSFLSSYSNSFSTDFLVSLAISSRANGQASRGPERLSPSCSL